MDGKVLVFDNSAKRYMDLCDKYLNEKNFEQALTCCFSALKNGADYTIYKAIATIYAEIGLYELSQQYWFYFLNTAPKDEKTLAYEMLAINFFYMENYLASSYYFHQKIAVDGMLTIEDLDKEIVDFFSSAISIKDFYRIVYPIERANYSKEIKEGRHALVSGDYGRAVKKLSSIPKCSSYYVKAREDLAIAYLLSGDTDSALAINKEIIKDGDESLTAYCNLASLYGYKEDKDKSKYYYELAKSKEIKNSSDKCKFATCALEQGEPELAVPLLNEIVNESPNELNMRFLLGLALINLNRYDDAIKEFSYILRVDPFDEVSLYYMALSKGLKNGSIPDKKILPLSYVDDIPKKVRNKRIKFIAGLINMPYEKAEELLRKKENFDTVIWGIKFGGEKIFRESLFVLGRSENKLVNAKFLELLMDREVSDGAKRVMVYLLTVRGYKGKFSFIANNIFMESKLKKLPLEKEEDGMLFFQGYATALSKILFMGITDTDKLLFATDKAYKKLKNSTFLSIVDKEDMGVLIALVSGFKGLDRKKLIKYFGAKKSNVEILEKEYFGEKND